MRDVITAALETAALVVLAAAAGLGAMTVPAWAGCAAGGVALLVGSFAIQLAGRGER